MMAWTAIDKLSIIWKSDLTDEMKRSFFQAAVVSILLYGCTTRTLTKRLEKKFDGNYARMLWAILNKSWRQYPTRHQLYGHQPPITKTIHVRRNRHARHCWRREKWRGRVRDICACATTWWWYIYIYIYIYKWFYIYIQSVRHDSKQSKFLNAVQLVCFHTFHSLRQLSIPRLKIPFFPTIYPQLVKRRNSWSHTFPNVCELQTASCRIWTWVYFLRR